MKKSTCFLIAVISFLLGLVMAYWGNPIVRSRRNRYRGRRKHDPCNRPGGELDFDVYACEEESALYGNEDLPF